MAASFAWAHAGRKSGVTNSLSVVVEFPPGPSASISFSQISLFNFWLLLAAPCKGTWVSSHLGLSVVWRLCLDASGIQACAWPWGPYVDMSRVHAFLHVTLHSQANASSQILSVILELNFCHSSLSHGFPFGSLVHRKTHPSFTRHYKCLHFLLVKCNV